MRAKLIRFARSHWRRALRLRRRVSGRYRQFAGRIAEEPEEIGIRPQQEPGIAALQSVLIGRHRTVEREEIGVLAIGFRKQPVALAVALAAHLFGGGVGFSDDDGGFAISIGPDFLRLLAA